METLKSQENGIVLAGFPTGLVTKSPFPPENTTIRAPEAPRKIPSTFRPVMCSLRMK